MSIEILQYVDLPSGFGFGGGSPNFPETPSDMQIFCKSGVSAGIYIYKNNNWELLMQDIIDCGDY